MAQLSFSGHQTFPFRFAWIPKGVELARKHPAAFFTDHSMVHLGVGKNMVASIRHWCETLGLISLNGRTQVGKVEELGDMLFRLDGADPYLEDIGTLWILQWQLVKRQEKASSWHYAFTRWNRIVFSRDDLVSWLLGVSALNGDTKTSPASLRRDVEVFVRTYVPSALSERAPVEDTFDCPLAELGLVREVEKGLYRFCRGVQATLPVEVFLFALAEYWSMTANNQETLSFERILYGPGSPGGAFQLSDVGLTRLLESLPKWAGITYDVSAGMRRLVRNKPDTTTRPLMILERYYKHVSRGAGV